MSKYIINKGDIFQGILLIVATLIEQILTDLAGEVTANSGAGLRGAGRQTEVVGEARAGVADLTHVQGLHCKREGYRRQMGGKATKFLQGPKELKKN